LALLELASGCTGDDTGRLDAEREADALCESEARVQLGTIDPERLDLDQHPTRARLGDRKLADPKCLGRARAPSTTARMVAVMSVLLRRSRSAADGGYAEFTSVPAN
jgi:hypothetical protein